MHLIKLVSAPCTEVKVAIHASRHGVVILTAAYIGMFQVKHLNANRFHLQCQC